MENFEKRILDKIEITRDCMEFFQGDPEATLEENNSNMMEIGQLKKRLIVLKSTIEKLNTQKKQAQEVSYHLKAKSKIYSDIEDNLPKRIHTLNAQEDASIEKKSQNVSKSNNKTSQPQTQPSAVKTREIPKLPYVSVEDFQRVPKYMKGRLTYDNINNAIDEFNQALTTRYEFLAKGFQAYSSMALKKRYKEMKSQETRETRGVFFVVAEDLKSYDSLKSESSRRTLFTIFRHLRLIYESRDKSLVRYAVFIE